MFFDVKEKMAGKKKKHEKRGRKRHKTNRERDKRSIGNPKMTPNKEGKIYIQILQPKILQGKSTKIHTKKYYK